MSGSKQPAEQGTLIFLCGGDQALFDRAGPLLDVMGKAKLYLGKVRPTSLSSIAFLMASPTTGQMHRSQHLVAGCKS